VTIPREQLRPGYGAGFQGAPLRPAPPDADRARREGGEGDGATRSETAPGADRAPGV
jgi:hypothetical protein